MTKTCEQCGTAFEAKRSRAQFCKPKCARRAYYLSHKPEFFAAATRSYWKRREQVLAARRRPDRVAKKQAYNGAYRERNRESLIEADRRRNVAQRDKRRAYMKAYNARPDVRRRMQQYRQRHAETSRKQNLDWNREHPERLRELRVLGTQRRRALLAQVPAETFLPIDVFKRDRWRCQLCGKRTPKAEVGTNAMTAPTLDHIVPLSRGGPHTLANTQCACRRCNCRKRTSVRGQLRLI